MVPAEGHDLERFYNTGSNYFWLETRYSLVRWLLRRFGVYSEGARLRASLLDVGCGPGNLLRSLPHGLRCFATDITPSQLRVARGVSGANVFASNVGLLPLRHATMDYSVLLDVAEHLRDDEALFREVARAAKPGGFVFVTAPAYQLLWGPHDDIHKHFRRYRLKPLKAKLRNAGLEIVEGKYLLPFSFFAFLVFRLIKKARRSRTDDFVHVSPFFNALLTTYFIGESTLSRLIPFPWGTIIYVVARKPRGGSESAS